MTIINCGTSDNKIWDIRANNPKIDQYLDAAKKEFENGYYVKKQQIRPGAVFRIPLTCTKKYGYGRILNKAGYAFYDFFSDSEENDVEKICSSSILFIIGVYDSAIKSGRWLKIGKKPLEEQLLNLPLEAIQDSIDPSKYRIYDPNTGQMRNAEKSECIGLEKAAVWEPEHVEDRLCDHLEGRPNYWVEQFRIK